MTDLVRAIQAILKENNHWSWLMVIALCLVATSLTKVILRLISVRLRRTTEKTAAVWDDIALDLLDGLKSGVVFVWFFHFLANSLKPAAAVQKGILIVVVACSVFQFWLWGRHLIRGWRDTTLNRRIEQDPSSAAALGLLYTTLQSLFIVVMVLMGLRSVGIDVGALVAGLGVGGIAVALAAQNILGDLLASLSIVLDKPFAVGDSIVAGDQKGTIEHIGLETTRLRSHSGEEIVMSNKDLLESRIHNYKSLWRRRVVHRVGVVYSTPVDALERIPGWIEEFVERCDKLEFERCHLVEYGNSSLDFEFVFYVLDPDNNLYLDRQQKILLDLFRKFNEEGIEMAYPTQTLLIEKFPSVAKKEVLGAGIRDIRV